MSIQLRFRFDCKKSREMRASLEGTDQQELIRGLGEMFVSFVQTTKKEAGGDENHDQRQNQ